MRIRPVAKSYPGRASALNARDSADERKAAEDRVSSHPLVGKQTPPLEDCLGHPQTFRGGHLAKVSILDIDRCETIQVVENGEKVPAPEIAFNGTPFQI
jgi:hypothetical protein